MDETCDDRVTNSVNPKDQFVYVFSNATGTRLTEFTSYAVDTEELMEAETVEGSLETGACYT